MEANNIFKKIFKTKKNVKSLCCTNLKYAFSIFLFLWENVSWAEGNIEIRGISH